jgi:hypothetical protein
MSQWRVRVVLPEADGGQSLLVSALAQVPVAGLRFAGEEASGDMIIELAEDSALDDLLRILHEMSPQVFISRADGSERQIKVRRLAPGPAPR